MQVIHSLNPKQHVGTEPEVQALRNQLSEKDRFIEHLEVGLLNKGNAFKFALRHLLKLFLREAESDKYKVREKKMGFIAN